VLSKSFDGLHVLRPLNTLISRRERRRKVWS